MLGGIVEDVRFAVRSLRAAPSITIAALLTLTLGTGATTAIFSIANGLALRPLPVKHPHDLVVITSDTALRYGFQAGAGWSYTMWDALRQRADLFDGAFAWTLLRLDLSGGGEMQPVNLLVASGDVFKTLGVQAVIGRTFTPVDDAGAVGPDGAVAVLSHRFWQRRFGGSRDVLGSRLLIEQVPVTIVGVAPESFGGVDVGQPFDIAIPFSADAVVRGRRSFMRSEGTLLLTVMLRLTAGQSTADATAALRAIQPQILGPRAPSFLREPFIAVDASTGISDRSRLRQQYLYPLVILSIASGVVLLIVCLNIGNLLLSRASARRAELSVRVALGASRWRLVRQYLVEALTLGSAGMAGGMLLAAWGGRALVRRLPFPTGPVLIDLSLDWRSLAFSVGVAVVAVVLFGAVPALYATRVPPIEALRDAGRATDGRGTGVLSGGLVVAQVALSIVLLAAAGLFVKTMTRLVSVPLGFEPKGVLVVSVNTARSTLEPVDPAQFQQRMLEAVMSVPGVVRAAGSVWTPVGTGGGGLLTDARGNRADIARQVAYNFVTPGWFGTYGTPIKMGRDFDNRDGPGAPRVALVNEAFRRSVLSGDQPIGAAIHAGSCGPNGCTVVGVVADAVYGQSLRDGAPPTVYLPLAQSDMPDAPFRISVRAAGDPADLVSVLAGRLHGVDPGVTFTFSGLQEALDASVGRERLLAMLAVFFGAVALLLSGIGLYGVCSYATTRRRAEIGLRLALGGQPHAVVRAMLGRIALLVCTGAGVGVVAALWLARFVAPLLYGLAPHDPVTLVASASSLLLVAALAAWIPASRAARIDPAQVLREV